MTTDITRQLSASVYSNITLRNKIIKLAKNPVNSNTGSFGIDESLLLKHALNARDKQKNFYWAMLLMVVILLIFPIISPIVLVIMLIITMLEDNSNKNFIKRHFLKNNFDINFSYDGSDSELVAQLENKTTKNITYYSGYSPFVGAGFEIGGWSFVIDIDKGRTEQGITLTPKEFSEQELYSIISDELGNLNFKNCSVEDKVYFNGKRIRDNKKLLPDIIKPPVVQVSEEIINEAMESKIEDARFYKSIQVLGWEGDLIVSSFFRVQKSHKTLFIENNYYVLPPIKEVYQEIDKIKQEEGVAYWFRWGITMIPMTFVHAIASVLNCYMIIIDFINTLFGTTTEEKLIKNVKKSPDYDYGASTSIRQFVSQSYYLQHFQKLDKEMFFKTIDKRILNGITDFLDSKNISASEFKERETSLLNNGIIVMGGNFTSQNTVTGMGATINKVNEVINPNKK